VTVIFGFATRSHWWQPAQEVVRQTISKTRSTSVVDEHDHNSASAADDSHAGHDHGSDDASTLELSAQAQGNIGLTAEFLQPLKLQTFRRSITVPGIVVERPGRTRVEISTPMAAVITHVHAVQGESVKPGTLLFQMRITAEALVSTQTDLLRTVGELDVETREIARLSKVTEAGAVSQKTLLERQYAKEKLEVQMNAQKEALRLHGLSERQIDDIAKNRRLLRDLQIIAPGRDEHSEDELHLSSASVRQVSRSKAPVGMIDEGRDRLEPDRDPHPSVGGLESKATPPDSEEQIDLSPHTANNSDSTPLILQEVLVHKGETVAAGTTLAVLADYSELYIQGNAFEQDVELLSQSGQRNWKITALFEGAGDAVRKVENLDLVYSSSDIDIESRSLSFFVRLPNEVASEMPSPNGQRFLDWKYRPGQRVQLRVPVEEWTDQIVLPVEAIAREGAESFVFQQNGKHFDRVPVHVRYRDSSHAVIASDGSLFPGDIVAQRGAHQMQMALKNKAGGGVDPHAGHNH
jgi:multidrug efflux pump subunit AcrA (membrane-fusion protein)